MRILWLNAGPLLPLDKGGKLRTWHLMRHLARRHHITYVSFSDGGQSRPEGGAMRDVCEHAETVRRSDSPKGTWRFYVDAARYLFDAVPYAVAKYRSSAYRSRVEALLRHGAFDALVCDFLVPLVNLPSPVPCPSILFTHNVETEIWRRHAAAATNPISRMLLDAQRRRMLRFERSALSRFDLVLAVSDADRQTFEWLAPGTLRAPIHVVQTGVDTKYFSPRSGRVEAGLPVSRRPAKGPHLVFTGSMDWLPNEDGMLYFVREILPHIRRHEPETTLSIIGRSPTPAVRRLAEMHGVEVTGRVDDVRPHVAAGTVYVVPLRIGGGTRLKIFEAMAMGKAVVSTTVGAEGLPVTPGQHVVIEDEPARFAAAVLRLVRDTDERRRLETAARRLVVERYDWSAVAQDFEDALERACGSPARSAAKASAVEDSNESATRLVGSM
jgi:sugar transferase (PEP-CTERM/EpsH1 system associated)